MGAAMSRRPELPPLSDDEIEAMAARRYEVMRNVPPEVPAPAKPPKQKPKPRPPTPQCSVPDCDRTEWWKQLCHFHYDQSREAAAPRCTESGCGWGVHARSRCLSHYRKWLRAHRSAEQIEKDRAHDRRQYEHRKARKQASG